MISLEKLNATAPIDAFSLLSDDDRERLLRAAETDVTILLSGETGTGKGQLARAIAAHSGRREMIEVNCAALPDELLGSELFGHKRGAFTGAVADRKGLLQAAQGKTVFLDEIGEVSLTMQRMLLRVVQRSHRTMKPLGADQELPVPPLRFIFATNRDLEAEVAAGRFREDLLRRIDVVSFLVPPLRERPDLVPAYTGRFLAELSRLHGLSCAGIEPRALKRLEEHSWPGNVRELKNVLERALVTAERARQVVIAEEDLRLFAPPVAPAGFRTLAASEAESMREALRLAGGNVNRAMKMLGISSRSSFYNRLKKHGIRLERVAK